jgi:phosphatidylglycerol:prolipoprotein diacylglycerol transferase
MLAFPIAFILSSLAGILWLAMTSPKGTVKDDPEQETALHGRFDAGLWALLGGLLGARLVFVLVHLGYYGSNPLEILYVWQGGLSWPGAAIGALLALYAYTQIMKSSFWELADALAGPVALLALGMWIGCQIDHCAYGVGVQPGTFAVNTADIFGVVLPRWPTQIVGAVCSAIILTGVVLLRERIPIPGMLAGLTLTLLAVVMLLLSLVRGDPVGAFWGLRLDTLGAVVILIAALSALALRIWRK